MSEKLSGISSSGQELIKGHNFDPDLIDYIREKEQRITEFLNHAETLESEVKTLKEQVAGLEELNRGLDYCAEQEEIKRKDAESRIAEAKKLPEKWLTADWSCLNDRIEVANWCADELKKALRGVGGGAQA